MKDMIGTATRDIEPNEALADLIGPPDDIQFARLVKQRIASCFAVQVHRPRRDRQGGKEKRERVKASGDR